MTVFKYPLRSHHVSEEMDPRLQNWRNLKTGETSKLEKPQNLQNWSTDVGTSANVVRSLF